MPSEQLCKVFGTKNDTNISIGNILKSAIAGSHDNSMFKL